MSYEQNLATSQAIAKDLLVSQFDRERSIAMRAPSHTDLWPGDRWPEAYLAIGEYSLAARALRGMLDSTRQDGGVPHLMQGSHKRFGLETNWIDRQVYRVQGAGVTHSQFNRRVTKLHAHPSWALGALAIHDTLLANDREHKAFEFAWKVAPFMVAATKALYKDRGQTNEKGQAFIEAAHHDEMTNSAGNLSKNGRYDPAINALLVDNNAAVKTLAENSYIKLDSDLEQKMLQTKEAVDAAVTHELTTNKNPEPEFILAAARCGLALHNHLSTVYEPVTEDEKHPQQTHLSAAECIEIARLTNNHAESQQYLARVVAAIAETGQITRFEGIAPTNNPVGNKIGRKQIWLPTAAEIVRIKT